MARLINFISMESLAMRLDLVLGRINCWLLYNVEAQIIGDAKLEEGYFYGGGERGLILVQSWHCTKIWSQDEKLINIPL